MASTASVHAKRPVFARLGRRARALIALAGYVGLAAGIVARGVLVAPGSRAVGDPGSDKTIYMWAFVWWPHAIGRGIDPFVSHAVWAPEGIDLSWVTGIPGPSLLAFPLTWTVGPIATYNVLAVLAIALAAWTAFLLAEWLTQSLWPSIVAGYLFGFSTYEMAQSRGHLNLTLVFLVPVFGLLIARRFKGEIRRGWFVVVLGLALALQLLTSSEIFSTTLLVGLIVGALAYLMFSGEQRARVSLVARESVGGIVLAGIVALPYLVHAFILTGPSYAPERSPFSQAADVLNFAVPTHSTWLRPPGSAGIAANFTANPVEAGAYLGVPLLAILALAAASRRRQATSLLLVALGVVAVLALGSRVRVDGHTVLPGPWEVGAKLPVTRAILPVRLSMFVALFAALVCAVWLVEGRGRAWLRWALALAAMIAVFPTASRAFWTSDVPNPAFFSGSASGLKSSDTALVFPFGKAGWSMFWQAENGMRYRMAGGHVGNRPPEEDRWASFIRVLISGRNVPADAGITLRRFVRAHRITVIVVAPGTRPGLRPLVQTLSATPRREGDVLVYRVSG